MIQKMLAGVVGNCVNEISLRAGAEIHLNVVRSELAAQAFDMQ
jgi:hypothetical protein